MKKIALFMILLFLCFALCGCKSNQELRFYVLEGEFLTGGESPSEMLALAKKKGRLVFEEAEIEGYLWTEHTVQLKETPIRGSMADGGSALFQAEAEDRFLLVLGNRVLYWGGFAAGSGSAATQMSPYIADLSNQSFCISFDKKYSEGADPRGNQQLYDHLVDRQLLSSQKEEQK